MNKLSKLTALLLALVLALSVPLQAMAEAIIDTETKYEAEVSRLLEMLYTNMMASEDYQELLNMTENMNRQDIVNFLERIIEEHPEWDIADYDAHILELFENYYWSRVFLKSYDYTNVGPFLHYEPIQQEESVSVARFAMQPRADAATGKVTTSASGSTTGLTTTKSVEWDKTNSKGTITLESFATGSTDITQTVEMPPLDIILVLDQSSSMVKDENKMPVYNEVENLNTLNKSNTYYVADGLYWLQVKWCNQCNGWSICDHLTFATPNPIVQNKVYPTDGTVEFYQKGTGTITRRDALIPAVQNFVNMVIQKAAGPDGDPETETDNVPHRIAFVGYDQDSRIYTAEGSAMGVLERSTGWGGGGVTQETAKVYTDVYFSLDDPADQQAARRMVANTTINNRRYLWWSGSGTSIDYGVQDALDILEANPIAATDTKRTRVVIVFTDGEPYRQSEGQNRKRIADNAISAAYTIKNAQKATVYSVGVLDGADPLFNFSTGKSADGKKFDNYSNFNFNKELHYISSNYMNPTSMDNNEYSADKNKLGYYLSATTSGALNGIFKQIANNIQTGGSTTDLTQSTVVKDVLTQSFKLPAEVQGGVSNVRVYTADLREAKNVNGTMTYSFADPVLVHGNDGTNNVTSTTYAPTIDGNAISVSGFNFSQYWCGTDTDANGNVTTHSGGKKLIIEIDFVPVDGFLGGNNVETNVTANSGIYKDPESANKNEPVLPMPDPGNVDVIFKDIQIKGYDQYIYLSNYANLDALLQSFDVRYTFVGGTTEYKVDGYRNEYAVLRYSLTDPVTGNAMYYTILPGAEVGTWSYVVGGQEINDNAGMEIRPYLTDDHEYEIAFEVFAKEKLENGKIPANAQADTEGILTATVYVFKPEVTFQDTKHKYMSTLNAETVANYFNDENYLPTQTKWYNQELGRYSIDKGIMMQGPLPTLEFTYAPLTVTTDNKIVTPNSDGSGLVTTTACVPVNVVAVLATSTYTATSSSDAVTHSMDVAGHTTSYRQTKKCDQSTCQTADYAVDANGAPAAGYLTSKIATRTVTETNGQKTETITIEKSIPEFVVHITDVTGDLRIEKRVDPVEKDEKEEFTFTLKLDQAGQYSYIIKDANGNTMSESTATIGNGGTFQLKDGWHIVIKDLPHGTYYEVTEAEVPGYTTYVSIDDVVDKTDGNTRVSKGYIEGGTEKLTRFINVYGLGSLLIVKNVEGDYPEGEKFTFELTVLDKFDNQMHGKFPLKILYDESGDLKTVTEVDISQKITFELQDGWSALITGLPEAAEFTIVESNPGADYRTWVKNRTVDTGAVPAADDLDYGVETRTFSAAIPKTDMHEIVYTNVYQYSHLTIKKTGMAPGETAIFQAKGSDDSSYTVAITMGDDGMGSATIGHLPLDTTFTVTELTDWSWRYTSTPDSATATINLDGATVTFNNTPTNNKWLSDESSIVNFDGNNK